MIFQELMFMKMTNYSLEKEFTCKEEVNILEKEFDDFIKKTRKTKTTSIESKLRLIKKFLIDENKKVQEIFKNTKLKKSDCITLSIIAQMLASRKKISVSVGFPRQLRKVFHAFLIYKKNNKFHMFEVVGGTTKTKKPYIVNQKGLIRRFKFTRPFVSFSKISRKR